MIKRLWLCILIIISLTMVNVSCGQSSSNPAEIIDTYVGGMHDIVVKVAPNKATRGGEYYRVCLYTHDEELGERSACQTITWEPEGVVGKEVKYVMFNPNEVLYEGIDPSQAAAPSIFLPRPAQDYHWRATIEIQ